MFGAKQSGVSCRLLPLFTWTKLALNAPKWDQNCREQNQKIVVIDKIDDENLTWLLLPFSFQYRTNSVNGNNGNSMNQTKYNQKKWNAPNLDLN